MNEELNILLKKLEKFKRKYFLFRLIRSFIYYSIFLISIVTVFIFFESKLYLHPNIKKALLYFNIFLFAVFFSHSALLLIFKVLKKSSRDEKLRLSKVISKFFPDIKDKLVNVIELKSNDNLFSSYELVNAAIIQKSNELKIFEFKNALNFKNIKRIFYYLGISLFISFLFFFINKSLFIESGARLLHYKLPYSKPASFGYKLLNNPLKSKKGEEFSFKVQIVGKELPKEIFINIEGNNFLMRKRNENTFEYKLNAVLNDINFYFTDLKNRSDLYKLEIELNPLIIDFNVEIRPPNYTKIESSILENVKEIKVPVGSLLCYNFNCFDTDSLEIRYKNNKDIKAIQIGKNSFQSKIIISKNVILEIWIKNKKTTYEKCLFLNIEVIPDLYPKIELKQINDSNYFDVFYFKGNISDDYGLSSLYFHINNGNLDSIISIPLFKDLINQEFYFGFDFSLLDYNREAITYNFAVSDNDLILGPKTSYSKDFNFFILSEEEYIEKSDENFCKINKLVEESQNLVKEIQRDMNELKFNELNKEKTDWAKSENVNSIIAKKNTLEGILNTLIQLNEENIKLQNTYGNQSNKLELKQKQIKSLFEELMNEEIKKLWEEFNRLAESFSEEKLNDTNKRADFTLDNLNKQLDRNLELLKRYKVEKQIEEIIKKVDNIEENELNESKFLREKSDLNNSEDLLKKDQNDMRNISNEIDSIQKEILELKNPLNFDRFEIEQKDIYESFSKTMEEIRRRKVKEASKSFQNTSEKLENLSFEMESFLRNSEEEEAIKNIQALKIILKNLINISLNQEDILSKVVEISESDPLLKKLKRDQNLLSEQFISVRDSIYALENRSPQIMGYINEEMVKLQSNFKEVSVKIQDNELIPSVLFQRLIITSINNLALFFNDLLEKMEEQNNSEKEGNCNSEKVSNKFGSMKKNIGNLKNQLQDLIQKLKNGKDGSLNKEITEALMQHELVQKMIRDIVSGNELSNSAKEELKKVDKLIDLNRKDVANKLITKQLIERNDDILSKLLDAENSESEKEFDNKRESKSADLRFYSNPAKMFEDKNIKQHSIENFYNKSFKFTGYYQKKQEKYFKSQVLNESQ
jgi:hypothetical protein